MIKRNFSFPSELCHVSLQVMSTWKARVAKRLKFPSGTMHPFPCSALLACFGNTRETAPFDQPSAAEAHSTVYDQPVAKAGQHPSHPRGEGSSEKRQDSSTHSERNGSANRNSSNHTAVQPTGTSEDGLGSLDAELDCEVATFEAPIPRASIIEMPTVSIPDAIVGGMVLQQSAGHSVNAFREQTCLTS